MAARTREEYQGREPEALKKGVQEIDKSIKSSDAASRKPSLPKINADLINEDDLTKEEEMAAIMKLERSLCVSSSKTSPISTPWKT